MNLTSTLERSWQKIFATGIDREINVSLAAFQFGQAIQEKHPTLDFCFDGRTLTSNPSRPNFAISRKGENPVILFFGTLLKATDSSPSASRLSGDLAQVVKTGSFNLLKTGANGQGYQYETVPLAQNFAFGVFAISPSGNSGYRLQSLQTKMSMGELSRFYFGQIAAEASGSERLICTFESPPGPRNTQRGRELPDLGFKLKDGRQIYVDALVLESSYSEKKLVHLEGNKTVLESKQPAIDVEQFFGNRNFLHLDPVWADDDQPRLPNTAVTAWLSSSPLSDTAFRSELVVMFYVEYQQNRSLSDILQGSLSEIDWEESAKDSD